MKKKLIIITLAVVAAILVTAGILVGIHWNKAGSIQNGEMPILSNDGVQVNPGNSGKNDADSESGSNSSAIVNSDSHADAGQAFDASNYHSSNSNSNQADGAVNSSGNGGASGQDPDSTEVLAPDGSASENQQKHTNETPLIID